MISRIAAGLAFATVVASGATRQGLFVDRSGSMKPYYVSGLIGDLGRTVEGIVAEDGAPVRFAFSTTVIPITRLAQLDTLPYGSSTYLDRVLDKSETDKLQIVWLVTDNVQDTPGDQASGNTEVFYARLRGEGVSRVTIFPVPQPPGHGGIVVYALLRDEAVRESYDRQTGAFAGRVGQVLHTEALRMKPLDRETVEVSFLRAGIAAKGGIKTYQTGMPVRERIEIRFRSRFEHLEIAGGAIKVVEGAAKFDSASLLVPERREISITPTVVQRLGAGDETEQIYIVDVDLGKIALKKDLSSLWKAAFGKSSEEARLKLEFLIEVPQKNFQLRKQFLAKYHADTLAEANATGKVYAVNRLPGLMSELVTDVRVSSPVVFRVAYPWWPALVFIVIACLAGGVLFLAVRTLPQLMPSKNRAWKVRAETEGGTALDCSYENGTVTVQRDLVGSVAKDAFQPADGVSLDDRSARVPISQNTRLKVAAPRRTFYLIFEEENKKAGSGATPVAPTIRRR